MENNIIGRLGVFKTMGIKPNFSALQRESGIDRHTIKKYYDDGYIKPRKEYKRYSTLDKYIDEIKEIFSYPGITKEAGYQYFLRKYGKNNIGSASNFRHYLSKKDVKTGKVDNKVHLRFETKPGHQLQVDWKESLKMFTLNGELIKFDVFSATLGYSRLHYFVYSEEKTTEAFIRCLIDTYKFIGGITNEVLTDNATSIVSLTNGYKRKHNKIKQLEKDLGINIKLCKIRSPQTKGKCESANRFINWLKPYNYHIKDKEELISLIDEYNKIINNKVNQTTKIPPIKLFEKEKEYLRPLINKVIINSYIENSFTKTVPNTLLIEYKGCGYSLPKQYINQKVKVIPCDNKLYFYSNTTLITVHTIMNKKFNYQYEHYYDSLRETITNDDYDIEAFAKENLKLLDSIGDTKDE